VPVKPSSHLQHECSKIKYVNVCISTPSWGWQQSRRLQRTSSKPLACQTNWSQSMQTNDRDADCLGIKHDFCWWPFGHAVGVIVVLQSKSPYEIAVCNLFCVSCSCDLLVNLLTPSHNILVWQSATSFIILSKNNWSLLPLCFTLSLESAPFFSSSTSFWYQFFHFLVTYSFTHHFFLFWFTTLYIYNSLSLSLPA